MKTEIAWYMLLATYLIVILLEGYRGSYGQWTNKRRREHYWQYLLSACAVLLVIELDKKLAKSGEAEERGIRLELKVTIDDETKELLRKQAELEKQS
jgi:hypothetical protein